jgi:hypothetical protein
MANLIELNVLNRNGVDFSPARPYIIDLDEMESTIREDSSGNCYFTIKEIKGLYADNGNFAKVNYVVDENIATIDPLAEEIFSLTVLQRRAEEFTVPEIMIFNAHKIMGYVREVQDGTFAGKSEFYYAEDGDPDGVYYIVDEPLTYFINSVTPAVVAINVENTLFVDSVYGNNATALPETLTQPYATIAAAMTAATAGQTVWVWPGDHNVTTNLYKDGVQLFLNPGTNLNITGAGNITGATPGEVFKIRGEGKILGTGAAFVSVTTCTLDIEADTIQYNGAGVAFANTDGLINLKAPTIGITNGTDGFTSSGYGLYNIDCNMLELSSANFASKPINLVCGVLGTRAVQRFKASYVLSTGHDFGVAQVSAGVDWEIDFDFKFVYLRPLTPDTGNAFTFSGAGKVYLRAGSYDIEGGGIYAGDFAKVFNYADINQNLVGGGISALPVISVSGDTAKLTNYARLLGETDDYVVSLGIVHDPVQTAELGTFENHGVVVQKNAGLTANIIEKVSVVANATMLVLGSSSILYGVTNTNYCINASTAQDIKCYGSPVSNCDVVGGALITNVITGTNLIWDTGVEVNY